MDRALLDTDAFSEVLKGVNASVIAHATDYRSQFGAYTISTITIMEIVDNLVMLVIPGAMDAGLDDVLFWGSLGFALIVAGAAAYPVNLWLIRRGQGHAVAHAHQHH